MKKALIEVDSDKNIKSIDTMSALLGFQAKDYEIVYKSTLDLLTKNNDDLKDISCFFGSLNFSKLVFNLLEVPQNKLEFNTYPFPLYLSGYDYYNRMIVQNNIDYTLNNEKGIIFIKPVKTKEFFASKVDLDCKNSYDDTLNKNDFLSLNSKYFQDKDLKDIECFSSQKINIDAEFRVYIQNGKVIGSKQYQGKHYFYLDKACWNFIERNLIPFLAERDINTLSLDIGVKFYHGDFGVLYKIIPFVIECNDAYAIGNYGLDNDVFVEFLETRFNELVKK